MAIIYVTDQKHRADIKVFKENQKHRTIKILENKYV